MTQTEPEIHEIEVTHWVCECECYQTDRDSDLGAPTCTDCGRSMWATKTFWRTECEECGKSETECKCMDDDEPRWPRVQCSCGAWTTVDPIYANLCSKCCRADNE